MSNCDFCAKPAVCTISMEGASMLACESCKTMGKITGKVYAKKAIPKRIVVSRAEPESEETVVNNYAQMLKQARESKKLSQSDFAKLINEKESVVHSFEQGRMKPSIEQAKRLSKALHIQLIEVTQDKFEAPKASSNQGFTMGDFIKIKKK